MMMDRAKPGRDRQQTTADNRSKQVNAGAGAEGAESLFWRRTEHPALTGKGSSLVPSLWCLWRTV